MTDFGSQKLYQDAHDEPEIAERIELPIPDDGEEYPTALPPTLDKLINGYDTAPEDDEWLLEPPDDSGGASATLPKPSKKAKDRRKWPPRRPKSDSNRSNRREYVAISVESAGMITISAGFWLIHPWCGLIVFGLCLILIGMAISVGPPNRDGQP